MKIAILGYGAEGQTAYEYWSLPENEVIIHDKDEKLKTPGGSNTILGQGYLKNLDSYDLLVRSPGLMPSDILAANLETPDILDKVTSVTNEFFRVCPTKNIIGVTGTKGKGTTSTLITKMLEAAGKKVHLGGNIGVPTLNHLKEGLSRDDYVVLELSSFQLTDIKYSPRIGVCLMVAEEHLNWHADVNDYVTAKQHMFANQKGDDTAIYFAENDLSKTIVSVSPGKRIPYFSPPGAFVEDDLIKIDATEICPVSDLKLLGRHNWQNVCAAVTAVWQITQDIQAIRSVLQTFTGLEHRLELVRELDDIRYYDDSFGTTPETAIVAIEAFEEPKVVILGGSDKGAAYEKLAQAVKENSVRKVVLIGDTAPAIEAALAAVGYTDVSKGSSAMQEIVASARKEAQAGDVVLLSTSCASFGLFKNYKDRGEQFKQAVLALS